MQYVKRYFQNMTEQRKRNWVFSIVVGLLSIALGFLPSATTGAYATVPRERVTVLSVDNSGLMPLGIAYSGVQSARVRVESGAHVGMLADASNFLNSAIDKDKLFEAGDSALAMVQANGDTVSVTLLDHYRIDREGWLFALFGLLLVLFGGVSGFGALVSLVASVMLVWKVFVPLLLLGHSPVWAALLLVTLLTALIMFLVAGFSKKAMVALIGSLLGTLVTCLLSELFGRLLKLDGSNLPYIVPLLSQSNMQLNMRALFFSMVFIANSGALMDLAMDISSACCEIQMHKPDISRGALLKSGCSIGRSVIGTMTTTLMLAYSGSYLSLMLYFAGQGTPVLEILNLKYVASEILITLVGSFGLVTVAPFTALTAAFLLTKPRSEKLG